MDKNVEVICIDDDSDSEGVKQPPQTSNSKDNCNILVISSDEDASEGEIEECDKNVAENVPSNKIKDNNASIGAQSQVKKTNFLAGSTTENLGSPVNVDHRNSTDKVNTFPQIDSNYKLQAGGSEFKSASTNIKSASKSNEPKWNLVAISTLLNSSKSNETIPSQKTEYTPGCNLASNDNRLVERKNCQSSDIELIKNIQNNPVPVITSQPVPIQEMSLITPSVQNSIAINVQSSSLQSTVRAPLAINVQLPRNPTVNQNSIQVPISMSQSMIRNTMPTTNTQNFVILSNGLVLKPPGIQQFPNRFVPNQSAIPVFMGGNIQNVLRPQTAVQNNNSNQSQIIVMQTVSKSTTQLSNSVPRPQKLKDFAQLVLVNPSQQKENQNFSPSSSSVNQTTLLNSSSNQVQFCVNGDSSLELRPLVLNSVNTVEQTVSINPLMNFSNGTQFSNVNVETTPKVTSFPTVDPFLKVRVQSDLINTNLSGVTQTSMPPWKQNAAPTVNNDGQNDPKHTSTPPWLKVAATQTEPTVKLPISVGQLLSCVPQSSQNPNLFQVLKPSDPKSVPNTVSEPNPNSLENTLINKSNSNLEVESNLNKNILHPPPSTDHSTSLSKPTQCDSEINIDALESKSLQPSHPNILQSDETKLDWKPVEISTGQNETSGDLQENLNLSSLDNVGIIMKTEDDIILIDDSSDEEQKETLAADLPLSTALLSSEDTTTETGQDASEKMLQQGQDIIRIQIDATLNKSFDHSGLKINVNNASFQNFPESISNLSSIDIKEEINGTNFTINYSSGDSDVPNDKQYTITNDGGMTDCKTVDFKESELFRADRKIKIENSDESSKVGEFKMENDSKCTNVVEEFSCAKIECKSESSNSYEDVSKIEAKSEVDDSSEIGSDVDVGLVNDSSNESDYEVDEESQHESTDLSETERDLNDCEEVPISSVSKSSGESSDKVKNESVTPKDEKPFVCPHCGFCVAIERNLEIHIKAFHTGKKAPSSSSPKLKEQTKDVTNKTRECPAEKIKFKCTSCDFEADHSATVNRHLRVLHGVYACIKCKFVGDGLEELKTHNEIHKTVRCELCDTMISSLEFHSHLSAQHPVSFRFKCDSCEFKANAEWQLRTHTCTGNDSDDSVDTSRALDCNAKRKLPTIERAGNKKQKLRPAPRCKFICEFCGFRALNESSLSRHHDLKHFQDKTFFQCHHCPFKAESKSILSNHNHDSHPEKSPYVCHVCNFRTSRKDRLQDHMIRHDKSVSSQEKPVSQSIPCKHCNFEADNNDSMMRHCQEQHENSNLNRKTLQSSLSTSLSEKKKEKEAATVNTSSVRKENISKKLYPCQYCKFIGISQSVLNEHRYEKHDDKLPYSCKKCSFRAGEWHKLERHEKAVHKFVRKHYNLYECKLCSFKTSEISLLTRHKFKVHRSGSKFKCSFCSYRTSSRAEYNNHIKNVHKSSQSVDKGSNASLYLSDPRIVINSNSETKADLYFYYCSLCNYRFKFLCDYEIHTISVHEKCKKCPCCWTFVNSTDQLFTHKFNAHSSEYKFKCPSCSFCSSKDIDISIHEKLYHKPTVCHYCDFSVGSVSTMNSHILKSHPERNPLICDKCGYQTMNETFMRLHSSEMHPKVKCRQCRFEADSKQLLLSHISADHPSEIVACTKCSFLAEAPEFLEKHNETCHDEKCDECGFRATSSEVLGMHKFHMHPKTYSLLCLFCSYRSGRDVNLIRHELNVHFKRTYRCTNCFFYSESISGLSDHFLKCHSAQDTLLKDNEDSVSALNTTAAPFRKVRKKKERVKENRSSPIKCRSCSFSTATAPQLYKHYADHHPTVYPWACMLCIYRTKRFEVFFKHLRNMHSVTNFTGVNTVRL